MLNISAQKAHIVPESLHSALAAVLGTAFNGISHNGVWVVAHLDDGAPPFDQAQASGLLAAHSPAVLLPTRSGSAVNAVAWLPYEISGNITFTVGGEAFPTAYSASGVPAGGVMASALVYSEAAILLGVSGYPVIERTI